ncbi:MAG: hypothetical protein ACLUNO_08200 [Oscillospiraceae bacterium]
MRARAEHARRHLAGPLGETLVIDTGRMEYPATRQTARDRRQRSANGGDEAGRVPLPQRPQSPLSAPTATALRCFSRPATRTRRTAL